MNKLLAHKVMDKIAERGLMESNIRLKLSDMRQIVDALCETECTCGVTATEHCPEHSDKPTDSKPDYYYKGKNTTYTEEKDCEVTCWNCGKTFLCECCDATCRLCGAPFGKSRCAEFKFVPKPTDRQEVEELAEILFNAGYKNGHWSRDIAEVVIKSGYRKHPPCNHFDEIIALNKDKRDLESHLDSLRLELEEVKKKPCKHVELNEKEVKMFLFGIPKEIHNFDFYNSMQEIAYRICAKFSAPAKRELDVEKLAVSMWSICEYPNHSRWEDDTTDRGAWRMRANILKDDFGKGELWK